MLMYQTRQGAAKASEKDIPKRTKITMLIMAHAGKIEESLEEQIPYTISSVLALIPVQSAPGKVSLTFDRWTSSTMKAYIAVTAHFVTDDWELKSELILFAELPGSHSGANMAAHLFNLTKCIITPAKVSEWTRLLGCIVLTSF
jgi:hypothetical protein